LPAFASQPLSSSLASPVSTFQVWPGIVGTAEHGLHGLLIGDEPRFEFVHRDANDGGRVNASLVDRIAERRVVRSGNSERCFPENLRGWLSG
jgi:hypothetical protein